jgi:hypothetical protein
MWSSFCIACTMAKNFLVARMGVRCDAGEWAVSDGSNITTFRDKFDLHYFTRCTNRFAFDLFVRASGLEDLKGSSASNLLKLCVMEN